MGWNQQMEYSFYFTRQIGRAESHTCTRHAITAEGLCGEEYE